MVAWQGGTACLSVGASDAWSWVVVGWQLGFGAGGGGGGVHVPTSCEAVKRSVIWWIREIYLPVWV